MVFVVATTCVAACTRADAINILAAPYANPAFSPDGPAMWNAMVASAERADRNFQFRAVLNPDSGPGGTTAIQNQRFAEYFGTSGDGVASAFRNAGGELAGYVWTDRGNRDLATVLSEIDVYMTGVYAGNVDGIFLDDFYDDPSDIGYYQSIFNHMQTNYSSKFLIGNAGNVGLINELSSSQVSDLISPLDILVSHEMDRVNYSNNYVPLSEASSFDESKFSHLIHDSGVWDSSLLSLGLSRDAGWFYATPDSGANPWDEFDTGFWNSMVDSVVASNIPEPGSSFVLLIGLAGLVSRRRR